MIDTEIKKSGTYETKSGLHVEILKTNVIDSNGFCVVGVITNKNGYQSVHSWFANGKYNQNCESDLDLVEQQPWIELYSCASRRGILARRHKTNQDAIKSINDSFSRGNGYILVSLNKDEV